VPHWKPPPQLVHAILPATGVGIGVGVAIGAPLEHALTVRIAAISSAMIRGFTKRVYRADELRLGRTDAGVDATEAAYLAVGGWPRAVAIRVASPRVGERERAHTAVSRLGQFSDDGRWWWDGKTWTATTQIVLPQLPPTDFEQAGLLTVARARKAKSRRVFWTFMLVLGWDVRTTPAEHDFREWTLQQLALATAYLLGPDEPMLAGEVGMYVLVDSFTRDLAIAITTDHVVVFRIDSVEGQPRWIALAARSSDVTIESRSGLFGYLWPVLIVTGWNGRLTIHGLSGVFKPQPVLEAWRRSVNAKAATR
jgi:hypothetical protein